MPKCPKCGAGAEAGQAFCGSCGAALAGLPAVGAVGTNDDLTHSLAVPTQRMPALKSPRSPARTANLEAMLPGTVIADRYRIVALVGRGGMGEVYRADDLKLGQPVALKFLPGEIERAGPALARLLDEVRIARQISHPNVCRVYDIGEAEGRHFLTMELIDGEDLASLLRRIGRVPPEKAVQIARQLCAGLAAAHDQRVLHRDLKPANVMIDGRGRARITDFGLAGLQEQIPHGDVRSGTPAYMAPEQLAGREVTVRSDLYALGLVLYELFAGRPAFGQAGSLAELRDRRSGPPPTPSSHVDGLDPAVERAILRCLEPDPALRPASALAVAAALPGGDPLAAALAAGETPAPDVVAAAPKVGSLRPLPAVAALAGAALLWSAAFWLSNWPVRHLSFDRSPHALADRARDLLARLGHAETPVDTTWGYWKDEDLLLRLGHEPPAGLVEAALDGRAPAIRFWYRESTFDHLVPETGPRAGWLDPQFEKPGARRLEMTTDGRLLSLRAVPAGTAPPTPAATDWSALLEAAGFHPQDLEPAEPSAIPPDFADTRAAWRARPNEPSGMGLRLEAAALGGMPIFFETKPDLPAEVAAPPPAATARVRLFFLLLLVLLSSVLAAALWLARRNLMAGRADRKGANRIFAVMLAIQLLSWAVTASHAPELGEFLMFFTALAWSLLPAGIIWILYLALEPLLRRRSPASLVSWTRLLAGRTNDPLVGRDLLHGALIGTAVVVLEGLMALWLWQNGAEPVPAPTHVGNLIGVPGLLTVAEHGIVSSLVLGLGFLVLWQLFAWALRSNLRGAVALVILFLFGQTVIHGVGVITLFLLAQSALLVFAFARLGLLAAVTCQFLLHVWLFFPLWYDPAAWFFGESVVIFVVGLLPALWGAWTATHGRSVLAALD